MLKAIRDVKARQKGFTVIEIMVVIAVITILFLTAMSYYQDYANDACLAAVKQNINLINEAISRYFKDHMEYPKTFKDLIDGSYIALSIEQTLKEPLTKLNMNIETLRGQRNPLDTHRESRWVLCDAAANRPDGYFSRIRLCLEGGKTGETPPMLYILTVDGGKGSGSYTEGQTVTVEAGSGFRSWQASGIELGDNALNPTFTFTMPPNDVVLTAIWKQPYPLTISGGDGATGEGNYAENAVIQICAGTKQGHRFDRWEVAPTSASIHLADANAVITTFIMPAEAVTITAHWQPITFSVTIKNGGDGATGEGSYSTGENVTVYAGTNFGSWQASGIELGENALNPTFTFAMPPHNVVLTVRQLAWPTYLKYRWSNGSYIVNGWVATAPADIEIPSVYNDGEHGERPVTGIGNSAFWNYNELTSITIPNSVTSIGNRAFHSCDNLTSITIPNSVTSIGDGAFSHCPKLTSITIPNSVTSIGSHPFRGCTGLTAISVESGNTKYYAQGNCLIERDTKVLIQGCNNSVIPTDGSITSIGDSAFYDCGRLTSITIPDSVTSIGSEAFSSCSKLTSITIPDSVTSIGSEAFSSCSKLTSITIPNSVTSIGSGPFRGCTGLTAISVDPGNTKYYAQGNCLIERDNKVLIQGCNNSVIPTDGSITSIGDWAFHDCNNLTSITIPDSVTSIGNSAFSNCSKLTSITIPNSVTSIGKQAFQGCSKLTSINIPSSVTSIGDQALQDCRGLPSITIPNSVTSIGNYAFQGCSELTSITIPNSVTSIGSSAFKRCSKLDEINFNGTKDRWEAVTKGNDWAKDVKAKVIHCTDGDVDV